ncbi:hypothetical protein MMC25_000862 [Agyrium rufum]|nr:hypothetical protein [Agyrium rufum]
MTLPFPTSRSFITSLLQELSRSSIVGEEEGEEEEEEEEEEEILPNRLAKADPATRNIFLTLHCLFPNELLPALDLLDRGLVTKFFSRRSTEEQRENSQRVEHARGEISTSEVEEGRNQVPSQDENDIMGAERPMQQGKEVIEQETQIQDRDQPVPRKDETASAAMLTADVFYVRSSRPSSSRYHKHRTVDHHASLSYEVRLQAWNCSCPAFTFSVVNLINEEQQRGRKAKGVSEGGQERTEGKGEGWRFGGLSRGEGAVPICKHLLACVLVERCALLRGCAEERTVSVEEAAGWAAGWGG